jgi:hypothetical protein
MLLSISLKIDILMNGEVQITDLVVSKLLRYKLKKLHIIILNILCIITGQSWCDLPTK